MKFLDIVARYPGLAHDSFIFNNSQLKTIFESGKYGSNLILGDGGYGLKPYSMTPLRNPATAAERAYNHSHIVTRNTVERKYGVWKRRFPCLSLGMRLKLETQASVIVACAVLHNICIKNRDPLPQATSENPNIQDEILLNIQISYENLPDVTRLAKQRQQRLINYFSLIN